MPVIHLMDTKSASLGSGGQPSATTSHPYAIDGDPYKTEATEEHKQNPSQERHERHHEHREGQLHDSTVVR